jgi:hypothetical protein
MENLMVLDDKAKKNIGMICFIPIVMFTLIFIYYLALLIPAMGGNVEPGAAVGITAENYNKLFLMLAVAGTISAGVLIYCIVLLARLKNISAGVKLLWLIILSTFVPVACPFFWYLVIKKEPKYVPIYPDIA